MYEKPVIKIPKLHDMVVDENNPLLHISKLELEVEFPLNSDVYFLDKNLVKCEKVRAITIKIDVWYKPVINYSVGISSSPIDFGDGSRLFKTKEDLLKSL